MNVLFEEHAAPQRAGGIEAATCGLIASLAKEGVVVTRSFTNVEPAAGIVPDCVHIHGIWSPTLARRFVAWLRRGIPTVVTLHGMLEPWALAHKKLKKQVAWHLYQKRLLNLASALHATSEREAGNLRKLGLKPPIAMIPWGVEMPRRESEGRKVESKRTEDEAQISAKSSIQNSKSKIQNSPTRTALFVGRIFPVKGLPLLVEAWAQIRPAGWKMKIVGPDEAGHLAEVQELVRKAGLEADFEFTGSLEGEALRKTYEDADLFVLPSYTENFGMVVVEALAHGVPVIASNGTPWKGLLEHECGWWPEISSEGIGEALQSATSIDSTELRLMGMRGRQWMQRDFSWDQVARRMADLYRSI